FYGGRNGISGEGKVVGGGSVRGDAVGGGIRVSTHAVASVGGRAEEVRSPGSDRRGGGPRIVALDSWSRSGDHRSGAQRVGRTEAVSQCQMRGGLCRHGAGSARIGRQDQRAAHRANGFEAAALGAGGSGL